MRRTLLCILYTFLVNLCVGQAAIEGIIKDETSRPVTGAIVSLLNTSYSTKTDTDGRFTFKNLPAGRYEMFITAEGYADVYQTVTPGAEVFQVLQQRKANPLQIVIITSQKREEVLQQTPMSITALPARKAEAYQLWNITDLTAIAPNLYTSHPGDNRNVTSIRGITNTSYDPAVVTYVDGVNQFNLDTYIPQLFDVERIEVLKGPQGTLYGRNAMGGVINILTKKPSNYTSGFAEASGGSQGLLRISAGLRVPLVKDKVFFGMAGLFNRTNGFYKNDFNDSDYDSRTQATGNYYLRFLPTERWAFTVNVKQSHNRNKGPFPLVVGQDEAFNHPFRLNQNAITRMIDDVWNASLSIQHNNRSVRFSSQSAYQVNHRYYTRPIDADFSSLDAYSIINNYGDDWNRVEVFTQEFNLQSNEVKRDGFKWMIGTYLFHQSVPVKQATHFGEDAMMAGIPDKNFSLISTSTGKNTGAAAYGDLTYRFSSLFSLSAGLRYDYEKRKQQVLGEYQKDPDPDPVYAFRTDTSAAADFFALSPKLTLALHPSESGTMYASYTRGFRAGGLTPLSSDPSQPALFPFEPEVSDNFEIGWKQRLWKENLSLHLAFFHTTINDVQVPTLILPDAVTIIRNTGKMVTRGFETELHASLFKYLALDYSLGYTDASYKKLVISQYGTPSDLGGKKQLFAPDLTSFLAGQFVLPLNQNSSFFMNGEWKYLGTQYFDLANTIRQSPYHLLNLRSGFRYKKAEVSAWIKNLGDQRYISYAYDFGAIHLGDPRTWGVTLAYRF